MILDKGLVNNKVIISRHRKFIEKGTSCIKLGNSEEDDIVENIEANYDSIKENIEKEELQRVEDEKTQKTVQTG